MKNMALTIDRQLAEFFTFLGHQVGLANIWMALSADHGVSPIPSYAKKLRLPGENLNDEKLLSEINAAIGSKVGSSATAQYVKELDYPLAFLDQTAFPSRIKEEEAEQAAGEAMQKDWTAGILHAIATGSRQSSSIRTRSKIFEFVQPIRWMVCTWSTRSVFDRWANRN